MKLDGAVVLISGASSGIGAATARACAVAGCRLVLTARREERLRSLAERLPEPAAALVVSADIRDPRAPGAILAAAHERFGRVDAVIANAGIGFWEPLAGSPDEHLIGTFEVNVFGLARLVREALPEMLARGAGHIVTVSSVASEIPTSYAVAYGASKGAVRCFTEALRREVAPGGIRVTEIVPGFVRTEMTARNSLRMPPPEIVGEAIVRALRRPVRRRVVPWFYEPAIWANRFFPGAVDLALEYLVRRLER